MFKGRNILRFGRTGAVFPRPLAGDPTRAALSGAAEAEESMKKIKETSSQKTASPSTPRRDGAPGGSGPSLPFAKRTADGCNGDGALSTDAGQQLESEDRYQALAENIPEAVVLEQNGRCVFVNCAGVELIGARNAEEVIGRRVLRRVDGDGNWPGAASTQLRLLRLNGQSLEVEATETAIMFRGRPALQVIVRDITARNMAEKTLRFQADVLSQVKDAVIVLDSDERIIFWNKGAEHLYLYSAVEALGRRMEEVHAPGWDRPGDGQQARDALESAGSWRGESIHRNRNGKQVFVESSISVLRNEAG